MLAKRSEILFHLGRVIISQREATVICDSVKSKLSHSAELNENTKWTMNNVSFMHHNE